MELFRELYNYKYYDTPEGTDVWKKVFYTSRYAAFAGFAIGLQDIWMYSHPKGALNTAARMGWYLGPMVGMATAFTVTTNGLQNFRGKNDVWNYFWGGAAAGGIFGAWVKSSRAGIPAALILGVGGMIKKECIDQGWILFPEPVHLAHNASSAIKHDWTLTKELGPKHYTVGTPQPKPLQ